MRASIEPHHCLTPPRKVNQHLRRSLSRTEMLECIASYVLSFLVDFEHIVGLY